MHVEFVSPYCRKQTGNVGNQVLLYLKKRMRQLADTRQPPLRHFHNEMAFLLDNTQISKLLTSMTSSLD